MAELFAGVALDGSLRFIGETARGRACDCRCPECSSPLVAKQGALKIWHFAHEQGQERPDCEVGAANLLRRIAIEILKARPSLELPPAKVELRQRVGAEEQVEEVDLSSRRLAPWRWTDAPAKRAAVATTDLANGVRLELHVDVLPSLPPIVDPRASVLIFEVGMPGLAELQSWASTAGYIERAGIMRWHETQDPSGLREAARDRLYKAYTAFVNEREAETVRRRRAAVDEAERREGELRRVTAERDAEARRFAEIAGQIRRSAGSWAKGREEQTSFLLYRLADGSCWVVYTLVGGDAAIRAWPPGRQDTLPDSVARFDEEIGAYRATHIDAILHFNACRASLRTTFDVAELSGWSLGAPMP